MRALMSTLLTFALLVFAPLESASAATSSRLAGSNRYATAVKISQSEWTASNTKFVYLTRGDILADALSAGTLTDGPILLTSSTKLTAATKAEIVRLGSPDIVVIGGTKAVSDAVAYEASNGKPFDRLAGANRYETSYAVARRAVEQNYGDFYGRAYVTDGQGFDGLGSPDAVAGGSLTTGPILLVNKNTGPTQAYFDVLDDLNIEIIIQLGGVDLGLKPHFTIAGKNRYVTASKIANFQVLGTQSAYLARGDIFADAVAAGSLTDGPVLLTRSDRLDPSTCNYLKNARPKNVVALGGTQAVSAKVLAEATACANNPWPTTDASGAPVTDQHKAAISWVRTMFHTEAVGPTQLISLSESERLFPRNVVEFAIDNAGRDWNEAALKMAQVTVDVTFVSQRDLRIGLGFYQGYRPTEVEYALAHVVVDYNEEAREAAKYLMGRNPSQTKAALKTQLINEYLFTEAQADWAIARL